MNGTVLKSVDEVVEVVPFGVQFLQPMQAITDEMMANANTQTHTGISDNGQDSDTD